MISIPRHAMISIPRHHNTIRWHHNTIRWHHNTIRWHHNAISSPSAPAQSSFWKTTFRPGLSRGRGNCEITTQGKRICSWYHDISLQPLTPPPHQVIVCLFEHKLECFPLIPIFVCSFVLKTGCCSAVICSIWYDHVCVSPWQAWDGDRTWPGVRAKLAFSGNEFVQSKVAEC